MSDDLHLVPVPTDTSDTSGSPDPGSAPASASDTPNRERLEDSVMRDASAALPVSGAQPRIDRQRAVPGNTGARFEDLEGYRGLAAVGIVVFHAYQFCRAGTSSSYAYQSTPAYHLLLNMDGLVSMFLVLSAFLLFLPIARKVLAGQDPGSWRLFATRRALRVLPLYWVAILVVWAYRNPTLPGNWQDLVEHLTFTQVFDRNRIFYTIGPAWSLAVEVFFYAFLVLLLWVYGRTRAHTRSPRVRRALVWAPVVLIGVTSLSYQAWALLTHVPVTHYEVWFNPLAKGSIFVGGMVLALVMIEWNARHAAAPVSNRALWLLRLAAAVVLGWGLVIRTDTASSSLYWQQLSTVGFVLLLASSVLAPTTVRWRRWMASPALVWCGLISYSVYIWHEPVLLYLDAHGRLSHDQSAFPFVALTLLVIAVPVGWLSYWAIEYPVGRLRLLRLPGGAKRNFYPSARLFPAEEQGRG